MPEARGVTGIRPTVLAVAGLLLLASLALVAVRVSQRAPASRDASVPLPSLRGGGDAAVTPRTPPAVSALRSRQTAPHTREIAVADLEALAEEVRKGRESLSVVPGVSRSGGWQVHIDSVFGSGILTPNGFTVTDAGVGVSLGLRAGDRVVSVNGQRLSTAAADPPWQLPRTHRDPERSMVDVTIDRAGTMVVETFRLR
jgi:membrane-associated protease RseP (regulator of RpoE activity)